MQSQIDTARCERCGTEFYALLTDGRCTACRHRHHDKKVKGAARLGRRLTELTKTPSLASTVRPFRRSKVRG